MKYTILLCVALFLAACAPADTALPADTDAAVENLPDVSTDVDVTTFDDLTTYGNGIDKVTVRVLDDRFDPDILRIPVGTEVTWEFQSDREHSVAFDSGEFSTPQLPAGASLSRIMAEKGNFLYRSDVEPKQEATILVE